MGVSCSVLEDLHEATNVNQIVRAMAVGVGAYCKAKVGLSYWWRMSGLLTEVVVEKLVCRCVPSDGYLM